MAFRGAGMLLGFLLLLQLLAAPTCLSHDEVGDKTCLYTIKVISVPVRGSQTSPTVAITFYNSLGQEAYFPAVPTSYEPECYSTAEVYNTSTPCLVDICKMRLHFDKLDADIVAPPRVFLTSVEVGNLLIGEGKKRRFDVNGWLAIDEPPFLIDRTFDLCYWMSMPRTTTTRAATTTMTTSGTTNCTTYTTIDGSTTITSSFCSITTEIPF